jgi:hypothetical protein
MSFPTDDELLGFDPSTLAGFDEDRTRRALADHPDLYRNHLLIALWLDGWITRNREGLHGREWTDVDQGFEMALRDIRAHLRQADLLPGGILHDEQLAELER